MAVNKISGITLCLVGIIIVGLTLQIPNPPIMMDEIGPRGFPLIGSIGMIICGLLMAFQKDKSDNKPFLDKTGWIRLIKLLIILVAYAIMIHFLGYLISTPIILFFLMRGLSSNKRNSNIKFIVASILITTLIYILFEKIFSIVLPSGNLF